MDPASGKVETVIQLPGFTRGLAFAGHIAFVGLSQLRASNPFTDIPLTDQNPERSSGVWAVNLDTGTTIAFLRFSANVKEIFAVAALAGPRSPHILARTIRCWIRPGRFPTRRWPMSNSGADSGR